MLKGCYNNQKTSTKKLTLLDRDVPDAITVTVICLTGRSLSLGISPKSSIKDLKDCICDAEGILPDQQHLIFRGVQVKDENTLDDYGISDNNHILHLVLRLRGGGPGILLSAGLLLDERFHYDFTAIVDKEKFHRGGVVYIRPCGWKRYALKVDGKYKDDIWLLGKGKRRNQHSSADEEWPVSYHGTSYNNGLSIAEEGYRLSKCKRFKHGMGIYSTPEIDVAFKYAETRKLTDGKTYKVVMQNRVNPKNVVKIDKQETGVGEYWISPSEDDIRPYGFCIREC